MPRAKLAEARRHLDDAERLALEFRALLRADRVHAPRHDGAAPAHRGTAEPPAATPHGEHAAGNAPSTEHRAAAPAIPALSVLDDSALRSEFDAFADPASGTDEGGGRRTMGRGSGRGSGGGQAKLAKRNAATSRGAAQTPLSSAAHDSDSAGREDVQDLRAQNSALQESLAHAEARADAAEHELKVLREKGEEAEKGVASVVGGDSGGAGTAPAASQEEAATSVETVGSEQPVAVTRDEHAVPAAVLEAEDSLLTFWMMRGGGESGDEAVAPWFRPDGAAPRTLDAEQLGAIVREKLNTDLDPAHDGKLHARLLRGSGATTGVLDETAIKAWLRCRFPRFQVNQMLKDFDMRTPVLNQLLGVEPREDGLKHFSTRTKEDVRHALERATSELVNGLYAIIDTVKTGMGGTQGSSVNLKFAGDLGTSGTFEGKYETGKVFDEGLEKYIGLPDPKISKFVSSR